MSELIKEALTIGWPLLALIGCLFVYSLVSIKDAAAKKRSLFKLFIGLIAACMLLIAIAHYKGSFYEANRMLPVSLVLITSLAFMMGVYFPNHAAMLRIGGFMFLVAAGLSGYGNWLPQVEGGFPPKEEKLQWEAMTAQQLADEGEKIIFGGIGKNKEQGAVGKGQCPLCHAFHPEIGGERAPNLWGITARKRLHDTSIEYIAESHVCPSCYVVGGFGVKGTENRESPMPAIHKPPISLSIDELITVDTWLFWHEGEIPPSSDEIRMVYEKLIPPDERPRGPREENLPHEPIFLLADGSEPVDQIFVKAQCVACHIIPGIPGAMGTIGPKLTMRTHAPARIKDKAYGGKATTVREYISESILYPSVYVTKGYPDNNMPKVFGTKLSGVAIDKMVNYLAQVEEGTVPPPVKQ